MRDLHYNAQKSVQKYEKISGKKVDVFFCVGGSKGSLLETVQQKSCHPTQQYQ